MRWINYPIEDGFSPDLPAMDVTKEDLRDGIAYIDQDRFATFTAEAGKLKCRERQLKEALHWKMMLGSAFSEALRTIADLEKQISEMKPAADKLTVLESLLDPAFTLLGKAEAALWTGSTNGPKSRETRDRFREIATEIAEAFSKKTSEVKP